MTNPDLLTSLRPVPIGIHSGPAPEGDSHPTLFRDPYYRRPLRGNVDPRPQVEFVSWGLLEQGSGPAGQGERPGNDTRIECDARGAETQPDEEEDPFADYGFDESGDDRPARGEGQGNRFGRAEIRERPQRERLFMGIPERHPPGRGIGGRESVPCRAPVTWHCLQSMFINVRRTQRAPVLAHRSGVWTIKKVM